MVNIRDKQVHEIWIFDVDGTFTDAGIYYDEHGNEIKKFSTRDAAGVFALSYLEIKTMVLTGRTCTATERRMQELHVDFLFQGIKNKEIFLEKFLSENGYSYNSVVYIGDDINDLAIMKKCGYRACPADACKEIMQIADYVSIKKGGEGAVRDIVEEYLTHRELWNIVVDEVYGGI